MSQMRVQTKTNKVTADQLQAGQWGLDVSGDVWTRCKEDGALYIFFSNGQFTKCQALIPASYKVTLLNPGDTLTLTV